MGDVGYCNPPKLEKLDLASGGGISIKQAAFGKALKIEKILSEKICEDNAHLQEGFLESIIEIFEDQIYTGDGKQLISKERLKVFVENSLTLNEVILIVQKIMGQDGEDPAKKNSTGRPS